MKATKTKKKTEKQKLIKETKKKHPLYNTVQIATVVGCSKQYVTLVLRTNNKDKTVLSTPII